jgi:acyl-CoA dehydrogenase
MAIDFTLSPEQKKVQMDARDFAENVLAPTVRDADAEPDPLKAFQKTKPAYIESYKRGIAFCMLPKQYGGGGLTNVELILAAEEICAVDPGFACTVLVNGLGLLPVWYCGTTPIGQKTRPPRHPPRRPAHDPARQPPSSARP